MITNLLQSIIDENVRSGFMHNDLHLENVVFDRDTYTLRTLDYGRVILDRVYMPKYTSNTDIDAVELLQGS
jgi:predicted unusual protein kinase regulating ubiquinone biosynthesis (AarF/ABC1/UbiB family)